MPSRNSPQPDSFSNLNCIQLFFFLPTFLNAPPPALPDTYLIGRTPLLLPNLDLSSLGLREIWRAQLTTVTVTTGRKRRRAGNQEVLLPQAPLLSPHIFTTHTQSPATRYRVSAAAIKGLAVSVLVSGVKGGEVRAAQDLTIQSRPILTPKTVLPLFFIVGVIFAPIGGLLLYASAQVSFVSV